MTLLNNLSHAPQAVSQVQVSDARDLLSVIPYVLGYQPAECLVVVCVRAGGRLGLVARADLTDVSRPLTGQHLAELVAARASEDHSLACCVVMYTAEVKAITQTIRRIAATFATALTGVVPNCESWLVGAGRYWSLDCADRQCCP
ncbi:MAG: DUF4192 domain-containing protein, partial [Promicromonosporaceae bacterium]|nr:DUF4192 domain-containing protein [Promicromonosporaceae bacterium]